MLNAPHLVVSISGHGFGHVAQTAPILNLLHERMPQLRLTIRSAVPLAHLRSRIHMPFEHLQSDGDTGMVMSSALDVCAAESRAAYQTFHATWNTRIADEAQLLRSLGADGVLSNVGYLPLAGAQHAGIPNVALCSLNWADIYRHYCGDDAIAKQIHACYLNADAFLRTTPGMAMNNLPKLVPVAPIAALGKNKRDELNRLLQLSATEKLVLVSMGGIASRLPIELCPRINGVRWLVQDSWQVKHPDAIVLDSLPISFGDLLASCDALLCKPGYGSFVEAACSGIPVLYVNRPDWPESPVLLEWLRQHGICREISREQLASGDFAKELKNIWQAPQLAKVVPSGADQVVNWLMSNVFRI
jgi:UDP:flavonoid glycosyltransferase YjiC (YdhE family)